MVPPSGLTTAAAERYLAEHGYNEISERVQPLWRKLLRQSASPVSAMLLVAALLSFISDKPFDGIFILFLLVLNVGISAWQEHKADTAIAQLNQHLARLVRVLRDGSWRSVPSRRLVPHDLIEVRAGDVIPADAAIVTANGASANEAALTGESLPKEKHEGDVLYSGSFLAAGLATAIITATGSETSFGKTLAKIDTTPERSALEQDILRISKFLSLLAALAVVLLTAISLLHHSSWVDILQLDLSLAIAGVPISLPAVMTLIIAFGVVGLAKKNVVVRRLAALEELANADLLLTDKTGTLTENRIVVNEVRAYGDETEAEARRLAGLVAAADPATTINQALLVPGAAPQIVRYVPADSERKHSTLVLQEGGRVRTLSLGAPQVIRSLCATASGDAHFVADVEAFATRGYRALALSTAEGDQESGMTLLALFALSDELRKDARAVVSFLGENGIGVVMVTGDNRAIAAEIADRLSIPGTEVVTRDALMQTGIKNLSAESFRAARAFAEILPEDKYALVEQAKRFYTVATNGDGVNDLPALKAANVSFAVHNAVDALKGAADIVLLTGGIAVMQDAFVEGRKIFARLYSYSLYRISESFRLIVTIVVLGLATGSYPLSPLQLILLALLNDIPIISLAFDRVRVAHQPAKIHVAQQFSQSLLYGLVGIANSLLLYFFAITYLHLPLAAVETLFFLKMTVSGHLLIYVAHTKERWWRYLPSRQVIIATLATQAVATALALTGFFMPARISWQLALLAWVWSFAFMQLGELVKRPSPPPLPALTPQLSSTTL